MSSMKDSMKNASTPATSTKDLNALVDDLNCESSIKCRNARMALVEMGHEAVDPLVTALEHGKEFIPLEAAKALGNIGNPKAVQALIQALEDPRFEVRWEAAEALVRTGRKSVVPLLNALVARGDSDWMRDGAHHVLNDIKDAQLMPVIQPVLNAIDDDEARLEVPVAAKKALDSLKSG
jgi:HEAT repeat protein